MTGAATLDRWSVKDSADLYGIRYWSKGFFEINDKGEVCVRLRENGGSKLVSMMEIIDGLKERGLTLPVLLRFGDLVNAQIEEINSSFTAAMQEAGYKGKYRGVYPIKVNQQEQVVREIARFGQKHNFGLEAGSKAELVAALAYQHNSDAFIICNGYKDAEFIDMALYGVKMGIPVVLVVEMPGEVDLIIERAQALGIEPNIGVRIKLSAKSAGHWNDSGGDRSVFGLSISQVVKLVDRLKEVDMLNSLRLLHYHQGSQIPNVRAIREAAGEAMRVYVNLVREGARMGWLDIGGGLAVDYDGSKTNFQSSCNYSIPEYCADVVEAVMKVADEEGVPHPTIISESGRATVAYGSVLLFNVFEKTKFEPETEPEEIAGDAPEVIANLYNVYKSLTPKNLQESYNDAIFYREELRSIFQHGQISLRDRAQGEHIFWTIVTRIAREVQGMKKFVPPDLHDIESLLVDIYHVNFSVFQSLPDAWAIDQLFPIMPVHRLDERPLNAGIMADITCDCDGKVDRFIDLHDVRKSLPLHELRANEDYVLGAFLVGAYQETLGDLHNLLGDTHVASIHLEDGEVSYEAEILGDSIADVLSYVEYDPKNLTQRFRSLAERAVRQRKITAVERKEIMDAYDAALRSYTYFRD